MKTEDLIHHIRLEAAARAAARAGDSKQHAVSLRPAAEATAGEAMGLDFFLQRQERRRHLGQPRTAAEALLEGAEYDAETENAAKDSEAAAAAARVRLPRPSNWNTMTRGQRRNWNQQGGKPR